VAGKVFNIACGARHTLLDVYGILARIIGFSGVPLYMPPRTGDILNSQADISAAAAAIGYAPLVSFEEGLKRTIDWYREAIQVPVVSGRVAASRR
jgi:UDP-glucose 4-epimerase